MTAAEFRKIALSLPGAEERSHMNHPDFRAGGKIFATLGYPEGDWGMVKLFPDQQEAFVTRDPEMFQPVKGGWGKQGCTQVILKSAAAGRVREAMEAAWERVSVKAIAEPKNRARSVPKKRRLKPAV